MQVKVSLELKDRNGNVKEKREFYSKSWVKNYIKTWYADIAGCTMKIYDRNGNLVDYEGYPVRSGTDTFPPYVNPTVCLRQKVRNANVGSSDSAGILIGTGDTPWDKDQYCLANQITGDVVTHGNMEIEDGTEGSVEPYVRLKRTFTNNSGSDITIKEVGLFFNYYLYKQAPTDETTNYNYMVIRDVLETPITLLNGDAITIKYEIFITY